MKKRTLSLLLCIVMCLSLMPMSAFAEENFEFRNLPTTGVTNITVPAGDDDTEVAVKDAFILFWNENIKTDGEFLLVDCFNVYVNGYHTWLITIENDVISTVDDGYAGDLDTILWCINNPNTTYDWWVNGTYSADTAVTEYDVWVDGMQVTSENKDNILSDTGTPTATFDPAKGELTLNNATITNVHSDDSINAAVYSGETLTVVLKGSNTVSPASSVDAFGFYSDSGDLTVSGDGDLTVTSNEHGIYTSCGNITISGGGNRTFYSTCGSDKYYSAVDSYNGDIDISGTGTLTIASAPSASAEYYVGLYSYYGSLSVSGSVVLDISDVNIGTYSDEATTFASSGEMTVDASVWGVSSSDDIIFSGTGKATISGGEYGAYLFDSGKFVLLNGTGAPISLTAGEGYKAVWNNTDSNSPVGGTNLSYYNRITGAPGEQSVTYDHRSSGGGGVTYYTLTFNTNGGSAISSVSGTYGNVIDLDKYVPTKDGFDFGGWYSDSALTNPVDEIKLTGNKTVYAKWNKENPNTGAELPFTDVKTSDWSYDDIYYVWEKGLMQGTSETTFAPKTDTSRAMIVTILYRLEGEPAVSGACPFTDVKSGSYYEKAITWAAANGIVKGYNETAFGPTDLITREQMAAIFYRYAEFKGHDVSAKANLNGFTDAGNISAYAKDAIAWANANNLVNGVSTTELAPQGKATREQVAAILHRFCENIVK